MGWLKSETVRSHIPKSAAHFLVEKGPALVREWVLFCQNVLELDTLIVSIVLQLSLFKGHHHGEHIDFVILRDLVSVHQLSQLLRLKEHLLSLSFLFVPTRLFLARGFFLRLHLLNLMVSHEAIEIRNRRRCFTSQTSLVALEFFFEHVLYGVEFLVLLDRSELLLMHHV